MNAPAVSMRLPGGWAAVVAAAYLVAAAGVWTGLWAGDWAAITGNMWEPPSTRHWLGTNLLGQDIFSRALAATATAFEVGLLVASCATLLGAAIGGVAGYFAHRWTDEVALWLMGTLDAIPFYLFVAALAFALRDHPGAMHLAMIAVFWTPTARLVRIETERLRRQDFVAAARVSGRRMPGILAGHIAPNLAHVLLVQATLTFVAAIKAEVILSFLGIGIQDSISWGVMMAEAGQEILAGRPMNFIVASVFLSGLILAMNRLADRLQDYLDPRSRPVLPQAHA